VRLRIWRAGFCREPRIVDIRVVANVRSFGGCATGLWRSLFVPKSAKIRGLRLRAFWVRDTQRERYSQKRFSGDPFFEPALLCSAFQLLDGFELDESLPAGEFSRSDPTSNIIFASTAQMIFVPIKKDENSRAYGTVFPVFGIEAGKNLSKPQTIAKTPVDLSHYDAIVRGYTGIDAAFGYMSKDNKTDDLTISGSYRVRLPAFDEPFVDTLHQVTTVSLTTKSRNWFEATSTMRHGHSNI
jgi:hypothetical protein